MRTNINYEASKFFGRRIVLLLMLLLFSAQAIASDQADILGALENGWNDWLSTVEFKGSYVYSESIAASQQEAEKAPPLLVLKSHGEFIKLGTNTLYSCFVDVDKYPISQLHDFIAVTTNELDTHYIPFLSASSTNGALRQLFVSAKRPDSVALPYPRVIASPNLDPLTYGGGKTTPNFISIFKRMEEMKPGSVSWRIESSTEQSIKVHTVCRGEPEVTSTTAVYNLERSSPAIVEVIRKTDYGNADVPAFERNVWASNFVKVEDGVFMPSKVHSVQGPLANYWGPEFEGKWLAQLWVSDDLGRESPTQKDFLIELHPGTSPGGLGMQATQNLKDKLKAGPVILDVNDYSVADLQSSYSGSQFGDSKPHSVFYRVCFTAAAICALVVIFMVMRWAYNKHSQ